MSRKCDINGCKTKYNKKNKSEKEEKKKEKRKKQNVIKGKQLP